MNARKFSEFFGNAPVYTIPGNIYLYLSTAFLLLISISFQFK
jgi:hypothetical protein